MKITFLVNNVEGGAMANLSLRLAAALSDQDAEVSIAYYYGSLPVAKPESIRFIQLGNSGALRGFRPLLRHLREEQPDFLLTRPIHVNLIGIIAAAWARKAFGWRGKLILGHEHPLSLAHNASRKDNKWAAKLLYKRANGSLAVSPAIRDDVINWCGLNPETVAVVPPSLPPYDSRTAPESIHPWLDDPKTPTFITTSRLVPLKRISLLIEALALTRLQSPAKLLIVGEGPARQRLSDEVAAAGLDDSVQLLGWVPEPRHFMAKATSFVLASDEEGFGMVLGEAMSTGCPVISTDSRGGGPAFVTEHGESGLLVPLGSASELSQAMLAMLNPEVRRDFAQRALVRAADFTPERNAKRLLDLLSGLPFESGQGSRIDRAA